MEFNDNFWRWFGNSKVVDEKTEKLGESKMKKSKALQLVEDLEYLMEVENLGEMSMRTVFDFKPIYMDRKTQELYRNVFIDFIAPSFFAVVKETKYRNEESADKFKYSIEFIPGAMERGDYNPRKSEVFRGLQGTFIDMRTGNRWLTDKIKATFGLTLKDGLSFD